MRTFFDMRLEQKFVPFFQMSWIIKTAIIPYKVIVNCQFNIISNILTRNEISETVLIAI